jgi:uncharacterized protein YndB with AHSA1/START domain
MATHDMVLTRAFDAPVESVWRAWTESEQLMRWWGPTGFTCPLARMDVRQGGTSLVAMRSPDGQDHYNTWTYTSVEPGKRLEFVQRFADQDGNQLEPADLGLPPAIPSAVPHVLTFEELDGGRTQLTVTESGYPDQQIVEVSRVGMAQCLDKLESTLQ